MNIIQANFNRFAQSYDDSAIVQKEVAKRLFLRLDTINPKASKILELGAGTGIFTNFLLKKYQQEQLYVLDFAKNSLILNNANNKICANACNIPFKNDSFDIIVSNLMLQWCFDIKQLLTECMRVLKPNGLFLFTTFGPLTLNELKQSWSQVDKNIHTNQFEDMHNLGDILQQQNFEGVVMEAETITLTYEKVMDLLQDLKNIGAQNTSAKPSSKAKLRQMINAYENHRFNGKLPASYEVIYGHCWKNTNKYNEISLATK